MEASILQSKANTLGIYTTTWRLKLAPFPVPLTEEVRGYLHGIMSFHVNANSRAWKENGVSRLARVGQPFERNFRDSGRVVEIMVNHPQLRLTQRQLWAYEKWVQTIGDSVCRELADTYQSSKFERKVQICYATPEFEKSPEHYRIASNVGDVVRMPCGTLAVISSLDFDCGGNCKILKLWPICGIFPHLSLLLREKLSPAEEQIDALVKVGEVPLA